MVELSKNIREMSQYPEKAPILGLFKTSRRFFDSSSRLDYDDELCSQERRVLSEEDKAIENAKWGLGIAAVIGLYRDYVW